MHELPDNSKAPKQFHMHVIAEYLRDTFDLSDQNVLAYAKEIEENLYEAGWEIIATHVMDSVIESGAVDPIKLAEANNVGN